MAALGSATIDFGALLRAIRRCDPESLLIRATRAAIAFPVPRNVNIVTDLLAAMREHNPDGFRRLASAYVTTVQAAEAEAQVG